MPLASNCVRLTHMMRLAKALTVSNIKGLPTIFDLDDVICVDPMLRPCLGTPMAMDHGLTPTLCPAYHVPTPGPVLVGVVDGVDLLGW